MDFMNAETTLKMIKEIEMHPIIYNVYHPNRNSTSDRFRAWTKITKKILGRDDLPTVLKAKGKWKKIRAGYVKSIKKRYQNGSNTKHVYEQDLQFLNPFVPLQAENGNGVITEAERLKVEANTELMDSDDSGEFVNDLYSVDFRVDDNSDLLVPIGSSGTICYDQMTPRQISLTVQDQSAMEYQSTQNSQNGRSSNYSIEENFTEITIDNEPEEIEVIAEIKIEPGAESYEFNTIPSKRKKLDASITDNSNIVKNGHPTPVANINSSSISNHNNSSVNNNAIISHSNNAVVNNTNNNNTNSNIRSEKRSTDANITIPRDKETANLNHESVKNVTTVSSGKQQQPYKDINTTFNYQICNCNNDSSYNDEIDEFFLCLAQSVNRLHPLVAAKIKRHISNLVMDAEIEALQRW